MLGSCISEFGPLYTEQPTLGLGVTGMDAGLILGKGINLIHMIPCTAPRSQGERRFIFGDREIEREEKEKEWSRRWHNE